MVLIDGIISSSWSTDYDIEQHCNFHLISHFVLLTAHSFSKYIKTTWSILSLQLSYLKLSVRYWHPTPGLKTGEQFLTSFWKGNLNSLSS